MNAVELTEDQDAVSVYKWFSDLYEQTQRSRIAMQNRLHALNREGKKTGTHETFLENTVRQLRSMERSIERQVAKEIQNHVLWEWLKDVEGVGPLLGARIIGFIEDINRFGTVGKLWRYAGLAVQGGKAERKRAGERIHYNPQFKSTMYQAGTAIMRRRGAYKRVYDDAKVYYQANRPEWDAGHIHIASMRKMEKAFLADLWEAWRNAECSP